MSLPFSFKLWLSWHLRDQGKRFTNFWLLAKYWFTYPSALCWLLFNSLLHKRLISKLSSLSSNTSSKKCSSLSVAEGHWVNCLPENLTGLGRRVWQIYSLLNFSTRPILPEQDPFHQWPPTCNLLSKTLEYSWNSPTKEIWLFLVIPFIVTTGLFLKMQILVFFASAQIVQSHNQS